MNNPDRCINGNDNYKILVVLLWYFLGLLSWFVIFYAVIKYLPEESRYSFFNIINIEVTYEESND